MKLNKRILTIILATAALAAGCQKSQEYYDAVYFTGTESSPMTTVFIDGPASINVTVTSSSKVTSPIDITLAVDPADVDRYNAQKGTIYVVPPEGTYRLSTDKVTIPAMSSVSSVASVELLSLDDLDMSQAYCIPVRITSTSDGTAILAASQVRYISLNQIIKTRGLNLNNSFCVDMESTMRGKPELQLSQCTMEIRCFVNNFNWNRSHYISSLIGVEENFLLRVGDVGIQRADQLQLAGRGESVTAPTPLVTGKWYHIAVVDNGAEMTIYIDGNAEISIDSSSRKAIDLGFFYNSAFCIGKSATDARWFDGYVSEARIWNRPLSVAELVNNQCYVDPATAEGLIGYWPLNEMDEAAGMIVRDLSGSGYDGKWTRSGGPLWTDEFRCPDIEI